MLLPFVKLYQLKGYKIGLYFDNIFSIKLSLKGKTPLKFTKRILRIIILFFALEIIVCFLILEKISLWWLILLDFALNLVFLPFILIFLHFVLFPIELLIKNFYINKTRKKLLAFKGKKIAITGSYGKTSTKNILKEILSVKYKVVATPLNYNTPMGLCKTVLNELKSDTEILIVEMGARHKGDIKELCDMLKPDIGILTSVGEQHIETFGNLDGVLSTKFELCESLSPTNICYFDCYNENTNLLYEQATCKREGLGKDCEILFGKADKNGMAFTLKSSLDELRLKTKLLGNFIARDIALGVMVSKGLGVSDKEIVKAVKNLKPSPHRLELISGENINILDDSYNSNFNGFSEALAVLAFFEGEKIVVTPGLVELGNRQYELNFRIGKLIANSCDKVIIMNKTNKKALKNGILSENFNKNNIFYAETREQQKQILSKLTSKNTTVLFENDLPDDYK